MALVFLKDSLEWQESPQKAIIVEALKYYHPRKEEIGDRKLTKEEIEEAIESFNTSCRLRDWTALTDEEKKLWRNNRELFDECTEIIPADSFLEMDDEYETEFNNIVNHLAFYVQNFGLKALVLGVSGGIDSTLASVICYEVHKKTGVNMYGISMPLRNTEEEIKSADITGKAWFNDFHSCYWIFPIEGIYDQYQIDLQMFGEGYNSRDQKRVGEDAEDTNLRIGKSSKIANGNIMARIRMTLLYHTAGIHKGLTISTGNRSENELGFFTIHGDEPMDYSPFGRLWKTEVYRMVEWYLRTHDLTEEQKQSLEAALEITPTDGNGISDSDLHQILGEELAEKLTGREGYYIVDRILSTLGTGDLSDIPADVVKRVIDRHHATQYKRDIYL